MKIVTSTFVIVAAAAWLRWLDSFHFVAGVLTLAITAAAAFAWKRYRASGEEDLPEETGGTTEEFEPGFGDRIRDAILGAGIGVFIFGLIAASSTALGATPVYGYFYGCGEALDKVQTLEGAKAYDAALNVVEQRLKGRASAGCMVRLTDRRARLLLSLGRLDKALQAAQKLDNPDLIAVVRAKLDLQSKMFAPSGDVLVVNLPDVMFEPNQGALSLAAREYIPMIAARMRNTPAGKPIRIEGHTDDTGPADVNQKLSEERAISVKDALIAAGMKADGIVAEGLGATMPVAANTTPEGRAKNRRVQVIIPK